MKPTQLFTIFSVVLLVLPVVVFAQNLYEGVWNPENIAKILGITDPTWLKMPDIIYRLFVPFIVAVTVIYGILTELRIFRRGEHYTKVNVILSIGMALLLLPSGLLAKIVNVFYAFGAFFALMAFGTLFIIGTALWAWGRGREIEAEANIRADLLNNLRDQKRMTERKISDVRKELLEERAKKQPNVTKIEKLENRLGEERKNLEEELERIRRVSEPT